MSESKRDTRYAREIHCGKVPCGESGRSEGRIELLLKKQTNQEEIRFSWWKDGKFMPRPLDLTERELLEAMKSALKDGVFSDNFRTELGALL